MKTFIVDGVMFALVLFLMLSPVACEVDGVTQVGATTAGVDACLAQYRADLEDCERIRWECSLTHTAAGRVPEDPLSRASCTRQLGDCVGPAKRMWADCMEPRLPGAAALVRCISFCDREAYSCEAHDLELSASCMREGGCFPDACVSSRLTCEDACGAEAGVQIRRP